MTPHLRRAERAATYIFAALTALTVGWMARLNHVTVGEAVMSVICIVWAWSSFRWRDATFSYEQKIQAFETKPDEEEERPTGRGTALVVEPMDVAYAVSAFALQRNLPPGPYTTTVRVRKDGSALVTVNGGLRATVWQKPN